MTADDESSMYREVVHARGHEHVTAAHASTFEVTTDDWLTPAGDCILAVDADRSPADFSDAFRAAARDPDATITCTIEVDVGIDGADGADSLVETITGRGHPDLEFSNDRSMVGRTSTYVDDRTMVVDTDAAAADVDRAVVAALADGAAARVVLEVHP